MRIKSLLSLFILVFISIFFFINLFPVYAATGINEQMNFQGKLVNTNGTNVTNGSGYEIVFSLYNVSSAGSNVWTETQTGVTVTDGIFRVSLGSVTALSSVDFNNDTVYLGVQVTKNSAGGATGDAEMTPRIRYTAVPYAFNAKKVNGLTVTNSTGTLTIPNSKTISFADSFTTSGANALTLTTSGITNATLPAGTVTLVDLAATQTLTGKTIAAASNTISGLTNSNLSGTAGITSANLGTDISATNLAATLSFANLDYVDLSAIIHGTTAVMGLRLPNASSATPSSPVGGLKGFLAYDTAGNQVIAYNGASWAAVGGACATCIINNPSATQTITSTQASGTILGISDTLPHSSAATGIAVTLTGTGAVDQTGISFALTGASGANLNDLLGSGSTWKVSKAGAATFTSVTSGTLDTSGAMAVGANSTGLTLGKAATTLTFLNTAWTATPTISGLITATLGLTSNSTLTMAANQNLTFTAGTGTLTVNSTVTTTDDAILVTPSFVSTSTAQTYNLINLAGFAPTNSTGTDNVNGIFIGNMTDPGASIISSALNIGSGWENDIYFEKGTNDLQLRVTAPSGASRVATIPALTANDNFVFEAFTQTLTNKTIAAGSNTISGITNSHLSGSAGITSANLGTDLSTTNLAAILAFANLDYVDLSLITHGTTAAMGLRLPLAALGTISNPTGSLKGFIAYDTTGNQLIAYNGASWAAVGGACANCIINNPAALQTITSTQLSGTIFGISDTVPHTSAATGIAITLTGTGAVDQTGISFALTGASGANLNDLLGSGSTWKISKAGLATFTTGTILGTQTFSTNNILDSGSLTIKSGGTSGLTLDTSSSTGGILIGNTSAGSVAIGNTNANTALTFNAGGTGSQIHNSSVTTGTAATSAFVFNANSVNSGTGLQINETALTTGTGINLTVGNPKANANSGVLSSANLINIASANHTYMQLDNRDLTIGGHKNNIAIAGVSDVFIYDTTKDTDGGRWTDGNRAMASSWYTEAKDNIGAACIIDTNDRCGQSTFPKKAIIVATAAKIYIFDAKDNTLWMDFRKGATTAESMIGPTTNSTISSVFALNGKIYVANNGSVGGLYAINFIRDNSKRYNATDDYQGNYTIANRNSGTAITWSAATGQALGFAAINDIFAQVVNNKQYLAIGYDSVTAANTTGSVGIINETDQTVFNFGITGSLTPAKNVFITPAGDLYAMVGAETAHTTAATTVNFFLKAKHRFYLYSGNANLFDDVYGTATVSNYGASTADALAPTFIAAGTFADITTVPNSLFVSMGTSTIDGKSNTIYVGTDDNLTVLQEKQGDITNGSVKYYTASDITDDMPGDIRAMLPLAGSGSVGANTLLTGADKDASVKVSQTNAANFTTSGTSNPTHTSLSSVRGTGMVFNGTADYVCSAAATSPVAGTCANNALVDFTNNVFSISMWVKTSTVSRVIINKQVTPGGATSAGYIMQVTAGGTLNSLVSDGTNNITVTSAKVITDGAWHHVVMVLNRATSGATCSATNFCNLTQYIDGTADGVVANNQNLISLTNANKMVFGANSAATVASFFSGSIDELMITGEAMPTSLVKHMYIVGYRALQNHTNDTSQQLNAGSSAVKGVAMDNEEGGIYIGTAGGGVTEVGMDSDTVIRTYTTSNTDDVGGTFGSNTVNAISFAPGYGNGSVILAFGQSGNVWLESRDSDIKDAFTQAYDPFGENLIQKNLTVDTVLRVVNQLTSHIDNLGQTNSPWPGFRDTFRVDAINGTYADNKLEINSATNFGGYAIAGAFIDRNSIFTEDFITFRTTATATSLAEVRGSYYTGAATTAPANNAVGSGEISTNVTVGTSGTCNFSSVNQINGIEQINPGVVGSTAPGTTCLEYRSTGTAATLLNQYQVGNLPMITMKMAASVAITGTQRVWAGITDAVAAWSSAPANGLVFTNCADATPTCDNIWRGMGRLASGTAVVVSCNQAVLAGKFAFMRIEVRSSTEVHFYLDNDVSDGVQEKECGNGITTGIPVATTNLGMSIENQVANGGTAYNLTVDYFRSWQDDAPGLATDESSSGISDVMASTNSASLITSLTEPAPTPVQLNANNEGQIVVKDENGNNTIVFDNKGNATFNGIITADTIIAKKILGLEIFTNKLSSLDDTVATLSSRLNVLGASSSATLVEPQTDKSFVTLNDLSVNGTATISADLNVRGGGLIEGILNVIDTLTAKNILVGGWANFMDAIFKGNVDFQGRPTFNSDTAGFATVQKGQDRVEVTFDTEYESKPIINTNITVDITDTDTNPNKQQQLEQQLFAQGYDYIVTKRTTKGFTIVLNKEASQDITFSWTAILVKDPKNFKQSIPGQVSSPDASVKITAPTITPEPTIQSTDSAHL